MQHVYDYGRQLTQQRNQTKPSIWFIWQKTDHTAVLTDTFEYCADLGQVASSPGKFNLQLFQSINQFIKIQTTNAHASVRIAQEWLHLFKQTINKKISYIDYCYIGVHTAFNLQLMKIMLCHRQLAHNLR